MRAHLGREVRRVHHAVGVEDRQALHQVGQFSHVAGPVVVAQRHHRRRRQPHGGPLLVLETGDQLVDEQWQVFRAARQRRHLDREHVETVVEILAEAAVLDQLFEVAVGGGDDAHVALDALVAADPLEGALLDDTQELHLHRQRHVADLVEEYGAALCQLEAPLPRADRPGERTLFVAEQLAFEQISGYGSAIDRHERLGAPVRIVVDVSGDDLLAGTGFPEDEHRRLRRSDLIDHLPHPHDRAAVADEASEKLGVLRTFLGRLGIGRAADLGLVQQIGELRVADLGLQHADERALELLLREV